MEDCLLEPEPEPECDDSTIQRALRAGRLELDADALLRCGEDQPCGPYWLGSSFRLCDVFRGTVPVCGECFWVGQSQTIECVEGVCMAISRDSGCPSVCRPLPGEEGDSCGSLCQEGLVCNDLVCVVPSGLGDACNNDPDNEVICDVGLACVDGRCVVIGGDGDPCEAPDACLEYNCIDGTCREHVEHGEPCNAHAHCPEGDLCVAGTCSLALQEGEPCALPSSCDHGLACKDTAEKGNPPKLACVSQGEGAPCRLDIDTCARGFWCDGSECRRIGVEGAICDSERREGCAPGLECDGSCYVPLQRGEACEDHLHCDSGMYCSEEGVCRDKKRAGQPCGSVWECRQGCFEGVCRGNCFE